MTESAKQSPQKKFEPVTFWMADPSRSDKIKVAGSRKPLQFRNGALTVTTKEQYDLVKSLNIAYEENGRKGKPHPVTNYNPTSFEAYEEHLKFIPSV